MRSCKVNESWKKVYKSKSNNYFVSINLNNFHGINQNINFPENGVVAFCGLNGVGKSSILASIKSLIGIELNESEKIKTASAQLSGVFNTNGQSLNLNNSNSNLISTLDSKVDFISIDFEITNKMMDKLVNQENVQDLIESADFFPLSSDNIKELNNLVGKNYKKIELSEIEIDDNLTIPYFRITENDFEYNTLTMGKGEYFLFYIYSKLYNSVKNTTFLIDEPENGISISSQKHLMDYIASKINDSKINVIITTHSPFILQRLRNDNIKILNRIGKDTTVIEPNEPDTVENLLNIEKRWVGVLIVEDKVAEDFLLTLLEFFVPYLLNDYKIIICPKGKNGIESMVNSISELNGFPFKFIGVFDGDVSSDEKLNKHDGTCCLPGVVPLEEEIRQFLENVENRRLFISNLGIDISKFELFYSKHIGEDYHDWFINLFTDLHLNGMALIKTYFDLIIENRREEFSSFVDELISLTDKR